ncbi:basic proline-rich protein-like [Mustela lutreola]|uniref:basic proline-rich protein-like n=1 Tax=Mustela lutreola TaxID=9666 RepID=UPI002796E6E7|nr:basic proline-rich protein-like [Mustela lutreola]
MPPAAATPPQLPRGAAGADAGGNATARRGDVGAQPRPARARQSERAGAHAARTSCLRTRPTPPGFSNQNAPAPTRPGPRASGPAPPRPGSPIRARRRPRGQDLVPPDPPHPARVLQSERAGAHAARTSCLRTRPTPPGFSNQNAPAPTRPGSCLRTRPAPPGLSNQNAPAPTRPGSCLRTRPTPPGLSNQNAPAPTRPGPRASGPAPPRPARALQSERAGAHAAGTSCLRTLPAPPGPANQSAPAPTRTHRRPRSRDLVLPAPPLRARAGLRPRCGHGVGPRDAPGVQELSPDSLSAVSQGRARGVALQAGEGQARCRAAGHLRRYPVRARKATGEGASAHRRGVRLAAALGRAAPVLGAGARRWERLVGEKDLRTGRAPPSTRRAGSNGERPRRAAVGQRKGETLRAAEVAQAALPRREGGPNRSDEAAVEGGARPGPRGQSPACRLRSARGPALADGQRAGDRRVRRPTWGRPARPENAPRAASQSPRQGSPGRGGGLGGLSVFHGKMSPAWLGPGVPGPEPDHTSGFYPGPWRSRSDWSAHRGLQKVSRAVFEAGVRQAQRRPWTLVGAGVPPRTHRKSRARGTPARLITVLRRARAHPLGARRPAAPARPLGALWRADTVGAALWPPSAAAPSAFPAGPARRLRFRGLRQGECAGARPAAPSWAAGPAALGATRGSAACPPLTLGSCRGPRAAPRGLVGLGQPRPVLRAEPLPFSDGERRAGELGPGPGGGRGALRDGAPTPAGRARPALGTVSAVPGVRRHALPRGPCSAAGSAPCSPGAPTGRAPPQDPRPAVPVPRRARAPPQDPRPAVPVPRRAVLRRRIRALQSRCPDGPVLRRRIRALQSRCPDGPVLRRRIRALQSRCPDGPVLRRRIRALQSRCPEGPCSAAGSAPCSPGAPTGPCSAAGSAPCSPGAPRVRAPPQDPRPAVPVPRGSVLRRRIRALQSRCPDGPVLRRRIRALQSRCPDGSVLRRRIRVLQSRCPDGPVLRRRIRVLQSRCPEGPVLRRRIRALQSRCAPPRVGRTWSPAWAGGRRLRALRPGDGPWQGRAPRSRRTAASGTEKGLP